MAADWTPPPLGSPCWFEIPAVDVSAAKKFYAALFPTWEWRAATEKYTEDKIAMFSFAGGANSLSGGITHVESKDSQGKGVGVTLYHLVASIEETQKQAISLGAKALTGKQPEGDSGSYMHLEDVAGNRFGIYEFKGASS